MEQGDNFLTEMLPGQIQVVGQPMAGVESAAIGILVGTGARDEDPAHAGISHFTEQMLFRGTAKLDARELSERFDRLGIDYDSSAGIEMTLIHAVMLGDRLARALDLLAEVVHTPSFPGDAIDNVRTTIIQEQRQREDRPAQLVLETLRQRFFAGSRLSHDVLGSSATIERMTRADLVRYWQDRYTANNLIISVAGNFDWSALLEQLRTLTAEWPRGEGRSRMAEVESKTGVTVIEKDTAQENIGFAFPGVAVSDPRYYAAALLSQALGGGMNSRLVQEVREKRGLAYSVQSRFDGLESTGLFRIYVGTSVDRAHESVEVVHDVLRQLERDGITDDELRLAKTRLKTQVIMRSESTSSRMVANVRSWWFEGRLRGLDEIAERVESVTLDQVLDLVHSLDITRRMASVALGPRSEDELFGGVFSRA